MDPAKCRDLCCRPDIMAKPLYRNRPSLQNWFDVAKVTQAATESFATNK